MRSLLAPALMLSLVACSLGIALPEGRIACQSASDCPRDWVCRAAAPSSEPSTRGLCYRGTSDAGISVFVPSEGGATLDVKRDGGPSLSDAAAVDGGEQSRPASSDAGALGTDAQASTDASALASTDASALGSTDASALESDAGASAVDASVAGKPTVTGLSLRPRYLNPTQQASVACFASDPSNAQLGFFWSADQGSFDNPSAATTMYTAAAVGVAHVECAVQNLQGGRANKSDELRVYPEGWLTLLRFSLDASDLSGHRNDGTVSEGSYVADRAGNHAAAIGLGGTGGITLDNESAFDLSAFSFVVTLSPTPGHGGTIVSKGDSAFGAFAILLYADNDPTLPGRLQYFQAATSGSTSVLLGSYSARGNTFFQLAVTRSQLGELSVYVDGVSVYRQTGLPPALMNDAPVMLGTGPLGAYWGTLDEVQLYDRVLTPAEVSALTAMQ